MRLICSRPSNTTTAEAEALRIEANTLTAELDNIGIERAEGLLTGRQAKIATDRINEKLAAIPHRQADQERLRVFDGIPLGKPEVADAVKSLVAGPLPSRRSTCSWRSPWHRSARVARVFNPQRVQVVWR